MSVIWVSINVDFLTITGPLLTDCVVSAETVADFNWL